MRAFTSLTFSSRIYPLELAAARLSISPLLAGEILAVGALLAALLVAVMAISLLRRGLPSWSRWATMPAVRYSALFLFLLITLFSVVPRLYTVKKLVIALWPYGLLAMAWLFPWRISNRLPLILLLTASLIGSVVNISVIPKDQWRELVAFLVAHGEATDSIWIEPRYHSVPLNYYLAHPTPAQRNANSTMDFEISKVSPAMSDAELEALAAKSGRVWLIYHTANYMASDPARRLERWLAEHFEPIAQLHLYRMEATLYAPK
jgi:hypothetical protein